MSAPDITMKMLDGFASLAGDSHLTLVLGAGASAPSGLPTWDEFARRLSVLSGLVATDEAARALVTRQDPTIVLEAAHTFSGPKWADHLNEALYGRPAREFDPSPLHLAVAGHYLAQPEATTVGTLNFDSLLEQAILTAGRKSVVMDVAGEAGPDALTVHHLHGAVFKGEEIAPVVGYNDFAALIADPHAWQRTLLSSALARGPLLLAGTSYRDPDIRHWLHLILRDEAPNYPALVTIVREGLGLDRETFDAIDDALVEEWQSIGLTALTLQDLADVALVIRELRYLATRSYLSPAERVRRVWSAHRSRFADLQRDYSLQLESDEGTVAAALGCSVHRASLWLANARGGLVRWASAGIRYSALRHAKVVPTGHDSPWIAGEAIGTEAVKLRDVERPPGVSPTWRSVLAIPVFASDGTHPDFATGVITFGLALTAETLISRQDEWSDVASTLSSNWGRQINAVAFSQVGS